MNSANEFLISLGKDRATYQTFPDQDGVGPRPQILHGPFSAVARRLHALNDQGSGVFVMVNHGNLQGRRAENVTSVAAYFVDLDGTPLPSDWPLPPTVIVESSPSRYHAYWRVVDAPLDEFEHTQKHLAALFAGDEKVCDLPRVMRLPGFKHQKAEPFESKLLATSPVEYTNAEIREWFGVPTVRKRSPLPEACASYLRKRQKPQHQRQGIDGALEKITKAGEGNRNHTLYRMAAAVANDVAKGTITKSEAEAQLLEAAVNTGLGEHEAQRTIHSAMRYAQ